MVNGHIPTSEILPLTLHSVCFITYHVFISLTHLIFLMHFHIVLLIAVNVNSIFFELLRPKIWSCPWLLSFSCIIFNLLAIMLALSSGFIQNPVTLHYLHCTSLVQATSIFWLDYFKSLLTDLPASTLVFSLQSLFSLKLPEWSFKNHSKSLLCPKPFNGFSSFSVKAEILWMVYKA